MAGRTSGLGNSKGRGKTRAKLLKDSLDYHEGLSPNQAKVVLAELGLGAHADEFLEWLDGQTCPLLERQDYHGKRGIILGIYEYDLFRWIRNKKAGETLVWD